MSELFYNMACTEVKTEGEKMKIKLVFGKGYVIPNDIISIDYPNKCGGIGNIILDAHSDGFWTGEIFIRGERIAVDFGNIKEIQIRNNLYETDEEWKIIWKAKDIFSYPQYYEVAELLKKLIQEGI